MPTTRRHSARQSGRRKVFASLIALIALLGTAEAASVQPAASRGPAIAARVPLPHVAAAVAAHRTLHIVAFGSSSTEGIGASSREASYPARLEADLNAILPGKPVTVVNRGVGGDDVDDMMVRLGPDVVASHPDLVIWQTGSNDPLRHVPIDRFISLTRDGIRAMRRAGIDVVLMDPQYCTMLNATSAAPAFRQAVHDLGVELHVPVIHRFSMMQRWLATGRLTPAQLLAPDGLHMADGGYAALAEEVAREILAASGSATISARSTASIVTVSPRS